MWRRQVIARAGGEIELLAEPNLPRIPHGADARTRRVGRTKTAHARFPGGVIELGRCQFSAGGAVV